MISAILSFSLVFRFNVVALAVRLLCVREVWSSNPGPVNSDSMLEMAGRRFDIYASSCDISQRCVSIITLWRNKANIKSFSLAFFVEKKNGIFFLPEPTGVARNFEWKGPKMEKFCDVILMTFFGDVISMASLKMTS